MSAQKAPPNYVQKHFFPSHVINQKVRVEICSLEMPLDWQEDSKLRCGSFDSNINELYMTAQLFSNGQILHDIPISTGTPSFIDKDGLGMIWNETLNFPVKIRDLSINSSLVLTAWHPSENKLVGGTTIRLFDSTTKLRSGLQKLQFHLGPAGDGRLKTETSGETYEELAKTDLPYQMQLLRQKYHAEGKEFPVVQWLDLLAFSQMKKITETTAVSAYDVFNPHAPPGASNLACIARCTICLPRFQYPVLYEERHYPGVVMLAPGLDPLSPTGTPSRSRMSTSLKEWANISKKGAQDPGWEWGWRRGPAGWQHGPMVLDWEEEEHNPVEEKYRKLRHDLLRGVVDPAIKPNKEEREKIQRILSAPTDHLKNEEKDLLWRFRYCLTDNKKALTKFLLSVDWSAEDEVVQVNPLLEQWMEKAEIDVSDALKLLGREKAFQQEKVRSFAVTTLERASDEDLLTYMLQLVQALRYDNHTASSFAQNSNQNLAEQPNTLEAALHMSMEVSLNLIPENKAQSPEISPLALFLIQRACESLELANYLYWYLKVGLDDASHGDLYRSVFNAFQREMEKHETAKKYLGLLMAQDQFCTRISESQLKARDERGRKDQKEEKLKSLLSKSDVRFVVPPIRSIPMPLDPTVQVSEVDPSSVFMFRSVMYPAVVSFYKKTENKEEKPRQQGNRSRTSSNWGALVPPPAPSDGGWKDPELTRERSSSEVKKQRDTYKVIIKNGDDLRQDQLIMQMIFLMDKLLKRVNLDLKLTPYRILATGMKEGMVEFVEGSLPISAINKKYTNSILEFLQTKSPDPDGPMGVDAEVMSNFVKSTAGYCVITYILGIGDRHLDNLMMLPDGRMFHIDFGFILGKDPKPMPPPFRLTTEMATAMGGTDSEHYREFQTYCCQAYNWLRKEANLILNLLSLMADADIETLSDDPDTVLGKTEEKFRLDLTDEQAEHFFLSLINDSLTAFAAKINEYIHQVAVALK